jgi:hypothetical protein
VSDHQPVFRRRVFADRPQSPRNTLFLNRDGDYAEVAYFSGLYASEWSWSPVFLDVDLDGYEDVLIATGFERDVQDVDIANQLKRSAVSPTVRSDALRMRAILWLAPPNLAFATGGPDLRRSWRGGDRHRACPGSRPPTTATAISRGRNMNDAAGIYRNDIRSRVAVRLKGAAHNTRALSPNPRPDGSGQTQSQELQAGGRYLSSDEPLRVFAASHAPTGFDEIEWRGGTRSVVTDVPANSLVEISEAAAQPSPPPIQDAPASPLFENQTRNLAHTHRDGEFDDLTRQPLLPRKLSQLGPGVAWVDLDQDGWEDLVIGAGRGGKLAVLRNDTQGVFRVLDHPRISGAAERDLTGVVSVGHAARGMTLFIGESNYEDPPPQPSRVQVFRWPDRGATTLATGASAIGPLARPGCGRRAGTLSADAVGGRYPEPASSRLYRWRDGAWAEEVAVAALCERVGRVSGALFCDLEGDGYPELVLADWGPLRIFRNTRGQLAPWTPAILPSRRGPARGFRHADPTFTTLDRLDGLGGVTAGTSTRTDDSTCSRRTGANTKAKATAISHCAFLRRFCRVRRS